MSIDFNCVDAAVDAFGEDAAEFIALTLKDADNFVSEIAAGLKVGDARAVHDAAHSLKGILKQAGASNIADTALKIEQAAYAADMPPCQDTVHSLYKDYAILRNYLTRHG